MSLSRPRQGSIVVGIDYDCREKMIYWTDVAGRTISRAGLEPGSEPETIISSGVLLSPAPPAQSHICCSHRAPGSSYPSASAWGFLRDPGAAFP